MSVKTKASKPKFLVSVEVRGEGNAEAMCELIESLDNMTTFIVHDRVGYSRIPEKPPIYDIQVDGKVSRSYTVPDLGFILHDMLKGRKSITVTISPASKKPRRTAKKPASKKQASVVNATKPRKNKVK